MLPVIFMSFKVRVHKNNIQYKRKQHYAKLAKSSKSSPRDTMG